MKALNIFNAVMLALAATFAVTLGAVWIMYAFNLDVEPRLRAEWRLVTQMTLSFLVLTLVAAFAFWGQHRQRAWRWPAQGAQLLALAGSIWWLSRLLT
ncbi:hypothetical protein [Solimonas variicoloris]|uniref:hypothetical protein n=1 Tax=Solimonas variicoloris TaxID=254408 RepID=UPI00035C3E3A|nr:hypothetical protein [Solimonas variicoloris]